MSDNPHESSIEAPRLWRQGSKVKLNIYDGDRPVCQTHNEDDARRIVESCRKSAAYDRLITALEIVESRKVLPLNTHEIRRILGDLRGR